MRSYIIRRLLLMIPTMFIVTFIIFFMIRMIPGDAIDGIVARAGRTVLPDQVDREHYERLLGLDVSAPVQYGRWMGFIPQADGEFSGLFQGNFGDAFFQPYTVMELVGQKWAVTFELGVFALIIAQLIALPIGIFSALRQDTWGDYVGRSFAILLIAVPSFWVATLVIVMPSIWWGYMIPIMHVPFLEDPIRNLRMFVVPAILLGMSMSGVTMRMTRTMMLEVLRQDYIRTAWAKGLQEKTVVLRHAIKNALIPVVTLVGLQLPLVVGGAVIMENLFNLPGLGRLLVDALTERDYPVVSGVNLFFACIVLLNNLFIDLIYAYLDPRIRYQ